jgi:pimeloyl-ACP methyl ester carboxylesterase
LPEEQIKVSKVEYDKDENGQSLFLNTIEVGDPQLPKLVMVHGYGGSGALFYKTLKGLSQHFYTICIDIVGMGASCRPVFAPKDNSEGDLFFVQVFEKWRLAMDNLT